MKAVQILEIHFHGLFYYFSGADDPPLEPPSHVELNKDALLDRIQQQQLREQEVVTRTDSVSEANEEDTETKSDEEDVDDEAKDEDSKRHDTKIGWFAYFFCQKLSEITTRINFRKFS